MSRFQRVIASRPRRSAPAQKNAEEGGCGVVGFASSVPVRGRHIYEPSKQMHNRGNGKGGGIAAASLSAEQLGVDRATLRQAYLLQVAYLDADVENEVEALIQQRFTILHRARIEKAMDYRDLGLPVKPPEVSRYFVRAKDEALKRFRQDHDLEREDDRFVEDELVYQNSFQLGERFYKQEQRAFVLSHARNLLLFKIVGFAEQVVQYYGLEDLEARIWIAHQRYPTKGRVWHPGGAHPFIGMNEALVHNGDFANYYSIARYLYQHRITPLFQTDTEVAALLFDLWHRVYNYPLEHVIEALAPTTELDFDQLADDKKATYRAIQALHMHGSPDGPWLFIVAGSNADLDRYQLLGVTDTSMLRPQVFALQEGQASIGLIASEKQAIDATLASLASEDDRFRKVADRYWSARGGSHTDGGAFLFTVQLDEHGDATLSCHDKFKQPVLGPSGDYRIDDLEELPPETAEQLRTELTRATEAPPQLAYPRFAQLVSQWSIGQFRFFLREMTEIAQDGGKGRAWTLSLLSLLGDRRYDCGRAKRSVILQLVRDAIDTILASVPDITMAANGQPHVRIDWASKGALRPPANGETTLVVCARSFPPEGEENDARLIARAYQLGWRRMIVHELSGQRFLGCGFGGGTNDVRIDVFGSSGDYLASGTDGMEIHVHGSAQDQVAQIMKSGKLVIHGDVGQTFMYGAKGGEVYVLGNAAGRPLINAAGKPRVVINGTCLDFLAESFMAGDPLDGGGFVILNGIEIDDRGRVRPQETPYPGSNLFSLASGGAIFVRDPYRKLVPEQLNGGFFRSLENRDWDTILPYLERNERHFGISVKRDLLTVAGVRRPPQEVYRVVSATRAKVVTEEAATYDIHPGRN